MSSPFASVARTLWERGYSVIPIRPGFKIPGEWKLNSWWNMTGWSQFCKRQCTEDELEIWNTWKRAGIGVCTGSASGVVALDFDQCEHLWSKLEAVIPQSPVTKRGKSGYTAFYRYSGEDSTVWSVEDATGDAETGGNVVELLSVGRQTVIPPTEHPKLFKPYRWGRVSLADVSPDDLPALPDNIVELFDGLLGGGRTKRKMVIRVERESDDEPESIEFLAAMLETIGPPTGTEMWFDIGDSIKSVHPGGDGFRLWDQWSAKDKRINKKTGKPEYNPRAMERRWEAFRCEHTVGTIRKYADDAGFRDWDFDRDRRLAGVSSVLIPHQKKSETITSVIEVPSLSFPPELITSTPGLVGEIAHWITSTAIKPQPALSLGAALALVGMLKAHRVQTETSLRTNLYVLGLAGSGSGKNHPLICIQMLLSAAGLTKHMLGAPGSEPGLIEALHGAAGRSIIRWDEMGHAIAAMCNPNAGTHLSDIMTALTMLFSEASTLHEGKTLASGARSSVDQPCLCVFGATVPGRFFETLTSEHAIDGFLARWIVFEAATRPKRQKSAERLIVPSRLLEKIRSINDMKTRPDAVTPDGTGNIETTYQPAVVPFDDEAREKFWEAGDHYDDMAERAERRGDPTAPIWVRAAEHAAKIALTVSDGSAITMREFGWALKIADWQANALCRSIMGRIGKNSTERNTKEVLRVIRKAGADGIRGSDLYRETMWLNAQERKSIISTLLDSDQIGQFKDEREGCGPRAVIYVAE